jgi:hypothetical protein
VEGEIGDEEIDGRFGTKRDDRESTPPRVPSPRVPSSPSTPSSPSSSRNLSILYAGMEVGVGAMVVAADDGQLVGLVGCVVGDIFF